MKAVFIIDNGNGTIRVVRDNSWNTPENKRNQLAKFNADKDSVPMGPQGVPEKYWAWKGGKITEAAQAVKDAIDAGEDAQLDAQAQLTPREKALVAVINTKLAPPKQITEAELVAAIRASTVATQQEGKR